MDDVRAPQSPVARIAGAPISWGVCEVPDRGYQLAASPVLAEMRQVGLAAHGLTAVGGFTPVVLHERTPDPLPAVERLLDGYAASGGATLVLSAATGRDNYDSPPDLDEDGWRTLLANLDRLTTLAGEHGVRAAPDRIARTHLNDVDGRLARQVQSGRVAYAEAVRAGLYRPLGQDTVLTDEPVGERPAADVHISAEHLRALLTRRALVP